MKQLEVLMSVMHQSDFSIAYKSKIESDLLIVNQCDMNRYDEIEVDGHRWRMISTTERGLSKSRNLALDNAEGDICLLCDDDETFVPGYAEAILKAYEEIGDAGAVVFNVERINYTMKKSYYKITQIREAPKYRGYSRQMLSFDLEKIRAKGIRMSERFGSGTQWGGGEEILFEEDIRRNGMKLYEHPFTIATVDYAGGSAWFQGYDEKYFYNLGAFIGYQFRRKPLLRELRILLTCYRLRREKKLSTLKKIRWMHVGGRQFKKDVPFAVYMEGRKR